MQNGLIRYVEPGSAAFEGGIVPGDCLLSVNQQKVRDIFDYRFRTAEAYVSLRLRDAHGEEYVVDIEKDPDEDLGIEFVNPMLDTDRGCANRCIFCFIDQMPPGMRETLYFKDDDTRLSFLTGNYVTLTNISKRELERIIRYRMSPINVSVHTTNPALRCQMLRHRGAGNILEKLDMLRRGCITVNAQIVLCPGYNDGPELERTLSDLAERSDCVASVSVVPVGITRYRAGLTPLRTPTPEECCAILDTVHAWQERMYSRIGSRFVYAADELYLKAERALPPYESYDEFPQLDNGVGMIRLLDFEVCDFLAREGKRLQQACASCAPRRISIATGTAAYGVMRGLSAYICGFFPHITVQVHAVVNRFFGEEVTVAGLVTGGDLCQQLAGAELGEELLITRRMLRAGEDVFLDDMHVADVSARLGVPVTAVADSGEALVRAIVGGTV